MTNRIIQDITDFIFISDEPRPADVIFLPGGAHPEQPEYAARLYREGYAPLLMPAGGVSVTMDVWPGVMSKADVYSEDYQTDCEFFVDVLRRNGVPNTAILGEYRSGHTRDNAFLTRCLADEHGLRFEHAMIVCKSFHARRCLMLYQLAFPETELIVCSVDYQGITRDNWYTYEIGIDRVLGELARCGGQFAGDIKEYLWKPAVREWMYK